MSGEKGSEMGVAYILRALLFILLIGVSAEATGLKGTYKCSGYNISGAGYSVTGIGGSCHFSAPLVLKPNGTYQMLPERGKYKISEGLIHLSESKFRGPGKLHSDGNMITFDYEYADKHFFMTYTCQDCPEAPPVTDVSKDIRVDMLLRFTKDNGLFTWINKAYLVPQEHAEKYAHNKEVKDSVVEGTARQVTRKVVSAGFQTVKTGHKYVVFLNSYGVRYPVAVLDLRRANKPVELDLPASLPLDLKTTKTVTEKPEGGPKNGEPKLPETVKPPVK